jgi:uncharacterized protein (DUF111 family)
LPRIFVTVNTPFGDVTMKLGMKDGHVIQTAPEYESCRMVSERSGQPLRVIYETAQQCYAAGKIVSAQTGEAK